MDVSCKLLLRVNSNEIKIAAESQLPPAACAGCRAQVAPGDAI